MSEEEAAKFGFSDEEGRRFAELGMRTYLALGLARSTSLSDATQGWDISSRVVAVYGSIGGTDDTH